MSVLAEGQWVIIEQPNGADRLFLLKRNTPVDLGRYGKLNTDQFIGLTPGLYYEILQGNKLEPLNPEDTDPDIRKTLENAEDDLLKTNEEIFDDNLSQKLSYEEIEKLKAMHASGEASASNIVDMVVAGNENFAKKNLYSKEKYLKKKKQKFLKWICPRLPTTRLLADHFSRKDPGRMLDLRIDSLSQLLGHSNLFEGGKYMIWDDSMGFATGAILSRLPEYSEDDGEKSVLVSVHGTPTLQTPFMPYFNLSEGQKLNLYPMGLKDIGPEPLEATPNHYNPSSEGNPEHFAKHMARWEERNARRRRARELFDTKGLTSLILVCDDSDPCSLIDRFAGFLGPSGRLVIFSKYKEPLLSAFIQVRFAQEPAFVDVSLTESWLRPYQTAAGRLHPEMTLPWSSGGGYLLTATRVLEP